jgi:hypothetical protein
LPINNEAENVGNGLKPFPTEEIQEKITQVIKDANCEFIYDLPH